MATTTGRIIQKAVELLAIGVEPIAAIEEACGKVSTTPAARDRAREFFITALARAERS